MGYNFIEDIPIYLQIIEHIKMQIINKKYLPKQKLPSVRELSLELNVNPNTVQKALLELEKLGLIFTERTNGKFVTENIKLIEDTKKETICKMINEFCESMKKLGIEDKQIFQIIIDERSKKWKY